MKNIIYIPFLLIYSTIAFAENELANILKELDHTLTQKEYYSDIKSKKIQTLKKVLEAGNIDIVREYELNRDLFHMYKNYKCDSAVYYATQNIELARSMNAAGWVDESKLQLACQFSIIGMFKEALDLLDSVDNSDFTEGMQTYYYDVCKQVYKNSSYDNTYEKEYNKMSATYRDTLITLIDPRTSYYKLIYAEKLFDENKLDEAEEILLFLLNKATEQNHDHAYITHALGKVYQQKGDYPLQQKYFALSAITDTQHAIKENLSLQFLAISLYETGDINRAYEYIRSSLEDAIFCRARLRTMEIANIFPIIDTAYTDNANRKQKQLIFSINILALLSLLLIAGIYYIYRQLKKLAKARRELRNVNEKLNQLNTQLTSSNKKLYEANHIKEEYIGHFLDLCSNYIDKLENYRKMLNKKAAAKQMEDLFKTLKSKDMVENELKDLYNNFDKIFLHLYPDFVEEFNALLIPEERFVLKPTELLNVEMRIYALIRLGISDSYKIAQFLRYSSNTIYNYRAKVKSKSDIARDEFEKAVMEIGSKYE